MAGRGLDDILAAVLENQRHPALMGQPQHVWEPPRLAPKESPALWKAKISALGNAIVPVQLMPVLLAIALAELNGD